MANPEIGVPTFDQSLERQWYRVNIGMVAEFALKAMSSDQALLKTSYYLSNDDRYPELDTPEHYLPFSTWAVPMTEHEQGCLDNGYSELNPFKMIRFYQYKEIFPERRMKRNDYEQLRLFDVLKTDFPLLVSFIEDSEQLPDAA